MSDATTADKATTAEKIAAAALAILEREGAEAVSMRRVAEKVGITPMAIYHHFPDRQALLTFVTDREFAKLADHMRAQPSPATAEARLLQAMDYYLDYSFARPRVFDHVFSQQRQDARRFPDDFRAGRSPTMNRVAEIVAEAMAGNIIRKDDVWEVAMDLWAFAHGYVALYRSGRFALDESEFRALFKRSFRRLIDGLKP
jgi:AcrR family transcriptional regulator